MDKLVLDKMRGTHKFAWWPTRSSSLNRRPGRWLLWRSYWEYAVGHRDANGHWTISNEPPVRTAFPQERAQQFRREPLLQPYWQHALTLSRPLSRSTFMELLRRVNQEIEACPILMSFAADRFAGNVDVTLSRDGQHVHFECGEEDFKAYPIVTLALRIELELRKASFNVTSNTVLHADIRPVVVFAELEWRPSCFEDARGRVLREHKTPIIHNYPL